MPQETNLNVSPYFDDFDKNKNFSRVLFKPGSPVQARELTTLQSILQNQIEQFGTHFFKEGSKVIPGNLTLDINFTCVQVEERFLGIPVSLYADQLVGLRITGARSGVTATIKKIVSKEDSDRGNITLYIKYEKLPIGRYGKPDDIAGAVYFFCSEDSQYITGQTLLVDGGITSTF